MGINVSDPTVKTKITMLSCGIVAVFMTIWRLWMRRGRFWWDDGWAFFSLLALFCQFASVFLRGVPEPNNLSQTTKVASYYLMASTFYAVIWSARQSILFSVIRLQPDPAIRRRLYFCSALMLAAVLALFAQLYWVCEPLDKKEHWKSAKTPQCHLPKQVAILQLVTDILADGLLVWAPLQMIRTLANKGLRRRLMFIFSTSVVTTIVSLVHAAYIVTEGGLKVLISALVEDSVSLMVANLPVLVTAAMRAYGVRVIDEDSVPTARLTTMRFDPFAKGTSATAQTQTQTGFFRSMFTRTRLAPAEGGVSNDGSTTLNGTTGTVWKDENEGTRTYRLDELRSRHSAELDGKVTADPRHVRSTTQEPCQYTVDCRYDGPYDGSGDDARKVTGDALGRGV